VTAAARCCPAHFEGRHRPPLWGRCNREIRAAARRTAGFALWPSDRDGGWSVPNKRSPWPDPASPKLPGGLAIRLLTKTVGRSSLPPLVHSPFPPPARTG